MFALIGFNFVNGGSGLKGQSNRRLISMNEVKQHRQEGSMWTVLKGRVYNLSPYMRFHPGGMDTLLFRSDFWRSMFKVLESIIIVFLFLRCRYANEGRGKRLHSFIQYPLHSILVFRFGY